MASSWPATSRKVTPVDFSTYILALDLPTLPMPPPILLPSIRKMKIMARSMMAMGRI